MFAEQAALLAGEVAGGVVGAGAVAGALALSYRLNKRRKMSGSKRDREDETMDYGDSAFQPDHGVVIGYKLGQTSCKTSSGVFKPTTFKQLVDNVTVYGAEEWQSLAGTDANSSFRSAGSIGMMHRYETTNGFGVYPQTIALPIFVFRLNSRLGVQASFPTAAGYNYASPLICFRLQAYKLNANDPYTFKWISLPPTSQGLLTLNCTKFTRTNSKYGWSTHAVEKHKYNGSHIELLYSPPTDVASTLTCGVVNFSKDAFAPPDEYYDNTYVIQNIRPNSGAYDIATPVGPNEIDRLEASSFWNKYCNDRDGNPIRSNANHVGMKHVFTWHKKFVKDFTPKDTTSKDVNPMQHMHVHSHKDGKWYDVSVNWKGDQTDPITIDSGYQTQATELTINHAGVFPEPSHQKWFMVEAWTRGGIQASTEQFSNTVNPSFDIRVKNSFTIFNAYK